MPSAKPSLDLVRTATDELVLRTLMEYRRLTRAELSVLTAISKPTASESVRRLADAGLVTDTGERTTGRGRVGSYYSLAVDVGAAAAVSVAPEGVVAETVDVFGDVLARSTSSVSRPARPTQVAAAMRSTVAMVIDAAGGPIRTAVVSAADPVDRRTGRLVHLPDAPFLVGNLDPVAELTGLVQGPIVVGNDVNWAAEAERAASDEEDPEPLLDFAYLFLGEGLGCAVVSDGEVRRGHTGLAGEVAHLLTTGPDGQAVPFTQVFADLGLRRPGSTAVDVDALVSQVSASTTAARHRRAAVGAAVAGVCAAIVALADPQAVVLGGPWGADPAVIDAVRAAMDALQRPVAIRAARVVQDPALTGARAFALHALRDAVVQLVP